jgi:fatty-acid peroxygenase
MDLSRRPVLDSTAALLIEGYGWLPNRWRRATGPVVRARVMGQHAVGLRGPDAVRFFYDESNVRRGSAVPTMVQDTLFGRGAVHTLDGAEHRVRKAMFRSLLTDASAVSALADEVAAVWDDAVADWTRQPRIVLFDEASRLLTRAVCRWAGVPLDGVDADQLARDLVAMVDGFATLGPRHWRARRARARREDWLARLVEEVRAGTRTVPAASAVEVVAGHRGADGEYLSPRLAAVELLNVLRPTVAVSWFVSFAGHALRVWPQHRARLREDGAAYAPAFVHEVRRFYPFAPFVGGHAARDLSWRDETIPAGTLILLDLYGQNHDETLWTNPYTFDPHRFRGHPPDRDALVPQGGGPLTGHRCPGEDVTIVLLQTLVTRLARLDYEVPPQDLTIPLHRIPTRPRSGLVIAGMRPSTAVPTPADQHEQFSSERITSPAKR